MVNFRYDVKRVKNHNLDSLDSVQSRPGLTHFWLRLTRVECKFLNINIKKSIKIYLEYLIRYSGIIFTCRSILNRKIIFWAAD